jgi:polysaccharide biosynthesis transport protein
MSIVSQSPRPAGGNQFGDAESDLPALGAALWRNKWQIARPTVLAALIAIAVVQMIPPRYLSEARVLIEGRDNVFLRPNADKDLVDRNTVDQEAVTSQVQLILSHDLAREVSTSSSSTSGPSSIRQSAGFRRSGRCSASSE